jgi:hypothetical protein
MISDLVIEPTMDYDFSKLYLGPPSTLTGGSYFTKIICEANKQLFIQTPKCLTKQGFIKNGKKMYTDLMFDNNDTVFINWIENLETKCQELICNKGQQWFENKLEQADIESAFTSPFKIFKSGKYYLLRVNVNQNIKIYDEKNNIINLENITTDKNIISILEIQGIKFTSRNFLFEIELKQSMIVSPDPFLDECFIKRPIKMNRDIKKQTQNENDIKNENDNENDNNIDNDIDIDALINDSINYLEETSTSNSNSNFKPIDLDINFDNLDNNNLNVQPDKNTIVLDIEELTNEVEAEQEQEDLNTLKEVDLSLAIDSAETITLKNPNQVYYEIYEKAKEKAKDAKKHAISAYLEMKNIKKTYMLDDMDESDSEFEEFTESLEDS